MAASTFGTSLMNAQTSLEQSQESKLLQQAQSASGPGQKQKIEKSAREFEALLLQGWLQQAEKSLATVPGADDDQDPGQDTMNSLGVQALAGAMAATGGVGLGAMIEKSLLAMAQKSQPPAANPDENDLFPLNSPSRNADRMAVSRKGSE